MSTPTPISNNPFATLLPTGTNSESWRWATVTSIDPLRIQLDGDSQPLLSTPDSLITPTAGQRVRVHLYNHRATIIGTTGGPTTIPHADHATTVRGGIATLPAHTLTAWNSWFISPGNLALPITVPTGCKVMCVPYAISGYKFLSVNSNNTIRYVSTNNAVMQKVLWTLIDV